MSDFDDDRPEMSASDPVQEFLGEMRRLAAGSAPEPSAELSAVLSGATPLPTAPRRLRDVPLPPHRVRRHPLLTAAAVAVVALALLVTGAATHHLPAYAQRLVSRVVNTVTPFHIDPVNRSKHPVPPGSGKPTRGRQSSRPAPIASNPTVPGPSASTPSLPSAPVSSTPTTPPASPPTSATPSTGSVRSSGSPSRGDGSSRTVATPVARPTTPAAASGDLPGNGSGHASGVTAHPSHGQALGKTHGKGSGHAFGVTAHPSTGAGADGGGRPAPSSPVPGDSGKHEGVQEVVAEAAAGIVPPGQGHEIGQPGVVRPHVRRGHREHLPPVRPGVVGG